MTSEFKRLLMVVLLLVLAAQGVLFVTHAV